jgi:hypothetical protein
VSKNQRSKDRKIMFKELVSEYQRSGFTLRQARKFASEEIHEELTEDKALPIKKNKRNVK